ncbi:hypothetical protein J6590_081680, partial [Homalodisca vitripennis]
PSVKTWLIPMKLFIPVSSLNSADRHIDSPTNKDNECIQPSVKTWLIPMKLFIPVSFDT